MKDMAGRYGWKIWLEDMVGRYGWKIWLEDMVGRYGWKVWLEIHVQNKLYVNPRQYAKY
ncbi:MAG: hypothetical protein OXC46_05440 [Thaumarchaeota archaeon]|nr:hypothetical protein [Nitrososphaerota archaeon]